MSDCEDDGLCFGSDPKTPRQARSSLGQIPFAIQRRKSVGEEPSQLLYLGGERDHAPIQGETVEGQFQGQPRIHRSNSNRDVLGCKEQWSLRLLAQCSMQEAWIGLQNDASAYERQASEERWEDLLSRRGDVSELNTLAQDAQERRQKPGKVRKGFDEFCTVALEYSKLLDVVMNQSPEYAGLAWGIMKILLFANINHAKLRKNIRTYLIEIGNQLGLVNQLLLCSPTDKMVEAVALLYSTFSKFLGMALRSYAESNVVSKIKTSLKAFSNPWDRNFQPLIEGIKYQFCRIQDLAHASHFRETLQSQGLLREILNHHEEHRLTSQRLSRKDDGEIKEQLRAEVRNEMREEMLNQMSEMFSVFETRWPQKFEDMIVQKLQALPSKSISPNSKNSPELSKPTEHEELFASAVATLEDTLAFRDKVFPFLQRVEVCMVLLYQRLVYFQYSSTHKLRLVEVHIGTDMFSFAPMPQLSSSPLYEQSLACKLAQLTHDFPMLPFTSLSI